MRCPLLNQEPSAERAVRERAGVRRRLAYLLKLETIEDASLLSALTSQSN
jgi:hypothetical protein